MKKPKPSRRLLLSALASAMLAAPVIASSACSPGYLPSDLVNGLRILAVQADKPYILPGESVTFELNLRDGHPDGARPANILWLGGCVNPPGDLYYGCFLQFAELFKTLGGLQPPKPGEPLPDIPPGLIGFSPAVTSSASFTTAAPLDIVSSRPTPDGGAKYGLMYVFFFACTGEIRPIEVDPGGAAGFLPLGCFDSDGKRLPADSFVPGYTQVYSFDDERRNENPIVKGLIIDGVKTADDPSVTPTVKACPQTAEERRQVGCFAPEPFEGCTPVKLDVDVDSDIAEIDPGAIVNGKQTYEAVWVDWLVDAGDITSGIQLISGVTEGYKEDHTTQWFPPSEPGAYTLWATVRDTRGGVTFVEQSVIVE
ncbi:MAG TPA: hypothetical protein PK156_32050 [Polyangium sp.]|nr:hypothetical protein [Polyangium sp.]